jgi:hypothetical protein
MGECGIDISAQDRENLKPLVNKAFSIHVP